MRPRGREESGSSTMPTRTWKELYVPETLSGELTPILKAADEVEPMSLRVAYLCRLYAFERASTLDHNNIGHGVRRFKTALLQQIKSDCTLSERMVRKNDATLIQDFYLLYYHEHVLVSEETADTEQRNKAYRTALALYDVLVAVFAMYERKVDPKILEKHLKVVEKKRICIPFNILPPDPVSAHMRFNEIGYVVKALHMTKRLSWPENCKNINGDLLDFLQTTFGFQTDNVANQRENLIFLVANAQMRLVGEQPRLNEGALDEVMNKLLENYRKWCKHLHRKPKFRFPPTSGEILQHKLLYIGLYLLIWGEAANLRFMPECLCYIYHHMAFELYALLDGNVTNAMTGENLKPVYGGDEEAFLKNVVTPIYDVIAKEVAWSKAEKSNHSRWRNYDDLNEYFWSVDCFRLGWPMRAHADFFSVPVKSSNSKENGDDHPTGSNRRDVKVNFVEMRSFLHVFRSFDRMWSFFILCLQALVIIAWNGDGNLTRIFDPPVFKRVLSVFITAALLKFCQAVLDVIFYWKARHCMPLNVKLRYLAKVLYAAVWVVVLPVTYSFTLKGGLAHTIKSLFGINSGSPSPYIVAVSIYLSPDMLAGVLSRCPCLLRKLESSDHIVVMFMMWWSQPRLYVGRGMHESKSSLLMYTIFWIVLIIMKLVVSYHFEIQPLVGPTKAIMRDHIDTGTWHEFFPHERKNFSVVVAIWAPIILVYFMDIQVWYAIMSTIVGGFCGACWRLGEIRTLGTLRSRFQSFPDAFYGCLFPSNKEESDATLSCDNHMGTHRKATSVFAQSWNIVVTSFREEDLINNREMNLLLFPCEDQDLDLIQWPLFLLAGMIPSALVMAKDSNIVDEELIKRIGDDNYKYMPCAISECYALFRNIINFLVRGDREKDFITRIFKEVDDHGIRNVRISALPMLYDHVVKLINYLLTNKQEDRDQVVILFQDMHEVVTRDIMKDPPETDEERPLFASAKAVEFPNPELEARKDNIKRLYSLLTVKESAMDVPSNLEARRRLSFFTNSLFMKMPPAPEVHKMLSFSVLTPYYTEEVLFSLQDLEVPNEDGVSILFYLQKIFPDEWDNFLERVNCANEDDLKGNDELEDHLRLWASYRGQTLTKTVRGMMYYRKALELQARLDAEMELRDNQGNTRDLSCAEMQAALPDIKFTFVVSCQQYGIHKRSGDPRAQNILKLMTDYPSLRVAYIDEVEEPSNDATKKVNHKVYYSVLVKAMPNSIASEDQVIYKIKLPGPAILGEGKPENQNHAIIFTRGEGLQTIDMNQDNYMEEALKMRNLLQEFREHDGVRHPTILGVREHIFTGSVSSLAWFMSNQETSFVTLGQRVLAWPLKVRFHYGHPDVFDRLFHLTRGGVSKASKIINLSEDIFSGFNSTLRDGNVTHHEYIQVGKGRDVGLNQISLFEAKVANGNGEQTLSRDVHRLGQRLDFFRMLSFYFTTVGFYISTLMTVLTVYVFLYGRLYLILNGFEEGLASQTKTQGNKSLQTALASQSCIQMGYLMGLPMLMEIALERGFGTALSEFILMQIQLAPVFFTFSLGTKAHYYGRTLLHGGAKYRPTGRGFGVYRAKFSENYRLYSRSHFVKGIELMILLLVYRTFGQLYRGTVAYMSVSISIWFMAGTWLFAPFLFNPSGFEWQKIVDDWSDWNQWISNQSRIGVFPEKSWESWWTEEQEHLQYTGRVGVIFEIVLAFRFFMYQYGLVYHLSMTEKHKTFLVFFLSWAVIIVYMAVIKGLSFVRSKFNARREVIFRVIRVLICVAVLVILIKVCHMTLQDLGVCILAIMPTGWGLLLIAQAGKPVVKNLGLWESVRALARTYEKVMGLLVFAPVAFLGWFPFISEFQSRMLFNQAFSRGLQISRILGGQSAKKQQ